VNSYPSLEVVHEFEEADEYTSTQPIGLRVTLSSGDEEEEEEEEAPNEVAAVAPFYPLKKIPNWWLVVGDSKTKQLIGIRRVTIPKKTLTVELKLSLPAGMHESLRLYVICDSYMGADQDLGLPTIKVVQGEESDEDSDEDEDEDEDKDKDKDEDENKDEDEDEKMNDA
jgi:pre-mRNA-splicing helicase BRR2